MVEYLRTRSLAVFGWYRIAAAAVVVILAAASILTA
jgi:undecaprenyl pyrophosphate phosphatase UppP